VISADCHQSVGCILDRAVLPAFSVWYTAIITLVAVALFVNWLSVAFDMQGPYRRFLLAPGVWYSEKEIVGIVRQQLAAKHLGTVDEDFVVQTASQVRANMPIFMKIARSTMMKERQLDKEALVAGNLRSSLLQRSKLPERVKRVALDTIVQYFLDTHQRAQQKWPWRWRVLGY
jgi:hypothetical protein